MRFLRGLGKKVILAKPHRPLTRESQNVGTSQPTQDWTPYPVTTTRLSLILKVPYSPGAAPD